ncbi:MAG: class I SAM-dependent methyltransferase [Gammaproteobacteria bacterium]
MKTGIENDAAISLNPRAGWLGWWPKAGWRAILDPENGRIRAFLEEQEALLPPAQRVLDAGAGKRPYAAVFRRQHYESCDMPGGFYSQAHDYECWLHDIPQLDQSYDAVVLTQVLEHVPDPEAVLRELARILKPRGKVLFSVPLNGPLHGEPWHFFQFTHYGIAELAHRTGFEVGEIEKVGGAFWQLGKRLPEVFNKLLKQYDPGRARKRGQPLTLAVGMTLALLPLWLLTYPLAAWIWRPLCYWLDRCDRIKDFTLGYTAVLIKS